jgi:hypothetical protein
VSEGELALEAVRALSLSALVFIVVFNKVADEIFSWQARERSCFKLSKVLVCLMAVLILLSAFSHDASVAPFFYARDERERWGACACAMEMKAARRRVVD